MSGPLVIVDTSEIHEGKLDAVKAGFRSLVALVEANEPRTVGYRVHLSGDGRRVTVIQVHRDSASAEYHMTVAASAFAPFAPLLTVQRIDVYGEPSEALSKLLRKKAQLLGGAPLEVHRPHVGFVRAVARGGAPTIER